MKNYIFSIAILLSLNNVFAQSFAKSLNVGNNWFFNNNYSSESVIGDTLFQDTIYQIIELSNGSIKYQRSDSTAVYQYHVSNSQEYVIYDLSWELWSNHLTFYGYFVVTDKGYSSFFNQGKQYITIEEDGGMYYEERIYCETFGLYDRWGYDGQSNWSQHLIGAQIDGVNYGTILNSELELVEPVNLLLKNYPNPFNPSTTISFSIQKDSKINITIYNIKGQKTKTLTNKEFTQGSHSIIWNGDNESNKPVSSGVYLYKLNVNGKTDAVRKCLLLK